jgi:hypothetical protein
VLVNTVATRRELVRGVRQPVRSTNDEEGESMRTGQSERGRRKLAASKGRNMSYDGFITALGLRRRIITSVESHVELFKGAAELGTRIPMSTYHRKERAPIPLILNPVPDKESAVVFRAFILELSLGDNKH